MKAEVIVAINLFGNYEAPVFTTQGLTDKQIKVGAVLDYKLPSILDYDGDLFSVLLQNPVPNFVSLNSQGDGILIKPTTNEYSGEHTVTVRVKDKNSYKSLYTDYQFTVTVTPKALSLNNTQAVPDP